MLLCSRTITPLRTNEMANPSNDQTNKAAGAAREAANEAAHTARAGADLAHRGVETARDNMQAGLDTAAQGFQRMTLGPGAWFPGGLAQVARLGSRAGEGEHR